MKRPIVIENMNKEILEQKYNFFKLANSETKKNIILDLLDDLQYHSNLEAWQIFENKIKAHSKPDSFPEIRG